MEKVINPGTEIFKTSER